MAIESRRSRIPKRNKKGQCPVKIGGRSGYRVFKFSRAVSDHEVEDRTKRLKEIHAVCGGWNALSNQIADHVRNGDVPVPLPDKSLSEFFGVRFQGWAHWRSALVGKLPSIPWTTLGESSVNRHVVSAIRHIAMKDLNEAAFTIADIDGTPERVVRPVPGTLHEAFTGYLTYVEKTDAKNFDRHSKVRQFLQRHPDTPLAMLGLDACRELIDYWRQRPPRHDGKGSYTVTRKSEVGNSFENSSTSSSGCI